MKPGLTAADHAPKKSDPTPMKKSAVCLEHGSNINNASSGAEAPYATSSLRRAHTVAQGRNMAEKTNISLRAAKDRVASSFLRAKDSHELLRKRSNKRLDILGPPRDAITPPKEPNHFTVGSVGQNGKIFLRPIRNSSRREPRVPPPAHIPSQSTEQHLDPHRHHGHPGNEPSRWSNSQLSELRPQQIPEEGTEDAESVHTESRQSGHDHLPRRAPQRARSFSTISEQRSVSRAEQQCEFRIFIDQPDDRPKSADSSLYPAVGVPSTHYRLGTPQFNDGTALHSSIYSRNTSSDNFHYSRFLRENWNASPIPNVYVDNADRPSFAASVFSGGAAIELTPRPAGLGNAILYDIKEPIEPSIFDTLVTEMDDVSVVRYLPGSMDIGAATPARIVAQITSESFMDYELVSDFFLTFRSYLSTGTLLTLLLARLQWAINRLQDDGRIVRIRTFAALRHWILNYFLDDFIPDYSLRARFCETINKMYDKVKAREGGGMSDRKILIDLKRCWYGKCTMYWEFQDQHIAYQNPDHPIVPGGEAPLDIHGDHRLSRIKSFQGIGFAESEQRPNAHHDRNNSAATAKSAPISAESGSVQATSCSLPHKSPQRLSMPYIGSKAPHPVPLMPTKPSSSPQDPTCLSPISSRRHPFHNHAHKRSGSFSDSARDDRAPLSLLKLNHQNSCPSQEAFNLGSLIRGELYPPAESCMTMMAPPSPPLPSPASRPDINRRSTTEGLHKPTSSGSGVKTIIGSIRRALHSRNGGQSVSGRSTNLPLNQPMQGRTSTVPQNVAFGPDSYRERKALAASKKLLRIDVLCDESLRQYQRAAGYRDHKAPDPQDISTVPQRGSERTNQQSLTVPQDPQRVSHLSGGSESIVIVDDTGFGFPFASGGAEAPAEQGHTFLNGESTPTTPRAVSRVPSQRSTLAGDECSLPIYYEGSDCGRSSRFSNYLRPSTGLSRRSFSVERMSAMSKLTPPSLRLRKYASFQSGMSKRRLTQSQKPNDPTEEENPEDLLERMDGPTLRRRPGGDLRQMRDGRGNLLRPESGSVVSDFTYSSVADSTTTRSRENASRPQTDLVPPKPRFSLLQTNSSQNIRRSFEAAVARFADIPDDDDGGIESTLLKLEGKWGDSASETDGPDEPQHSNRAQNGAREQELLYHGNQTGQTSHAAVGFDGRRHQPFLGEGLAYSHLPGRFVPHRPYSDSIAESEDSYSSVPLLERGLSDETMKRPMGNRSVSSHAVPLRFQSSDVSTRDTSDRDSSHPSFDIVKETESLRNIRRGSTLPAPVPQGPRKRTTRLSNLSSELSVDMIDHQEAVDHRLSIDSRSVRSSLGIPRHPLAHPPSPPMTIQNPRSVASCATPLNPVVFQEQPPTPDPSPNRKVEPGHFRAIDMQAVSSDVLSQSERDRQRLGPQMASGPDHVPFILSCESQTLAQQLTLVEVAALSEVDWRDLVDMRWSSGSPAALNWVNFLMDEDRRGIDLVVGRFNLMVKWVLSEIILTRDIHERARTVTKFIHTAVHARRICNYATMLQIAIALSSTDCSRLQGTWNLVEPRDRRLLKDMESLIQPVRNFHELRVEMETASVQEGCIPFVGLYIHDLTYNAQKPAQVGGGDGGEMLINFERYRTAAKIVKSLLRLIDASTKYTFEPMQGVIERCLWIASLPEEQIQTRSKQLD